MQQKLNVFMNHIHIGELIQNKKNQLVFTYSESWLLNPKVFSFSLPFNLREEPYTGSVVFNYFDNLLPDNVSVRKKIAQLTHANSSEVFDLLVRIGKDCVGALQFVSEDEVLPTLQQPEGELVSDAEILKTIKNLEFYPLGLVSTKDFRLSLAGMQEKTAFLRYKNQWLRPKNSTPTTHIFKPAMNSEKAPVSLMNSVENEWLCAQIVQAFGLPVAKTEMLEIDSYKILVIERFDRLWRDDFLIRLPQEDFCQALSISSDHKYEIDGGPGLKTIMTILETSKNREQDRKNFMKTQILYWALAAIDGHGKNFSLFHSPEGYMLTPLYDIISAAPLVKNQKIQFQDLKMSMCIGDKRRYKISEIQRRHWQQTAKICHFSVQEIEQVMQELIDLVDLVIQQVSKKMPQDFPQIVSDSIFDILSKNIKLLKI